LVGRRVVTQAVERTRKGPLAALADLLAELDQRCAIRPRGVEPSALELDHREIFVGLELADPVAGNFRTRTRLLEEADRLVELVLMEAQHPQRPRDRAMADALALRERLRLHQQRLGLREVALEHREAARGLGEPRDVVGFAAAPRDPLRLQDLLV